jgi:hypothetical protein
MGAAITSTWMEKLVLADAAYHGVDIHLQQHQW